MTSPLTATPNPNAIETVELAPSYWLSVGFTLLALPLFWIQPWLGGLVALFGLFLLIQTAMIRLRFTPMALEVYRGEQLLRHFPYQEWQNWRIFWVNVPILFYFREVKSIHFLPILFDPKVLKACLEQRCPQI